MGRKARKVEAEDIEAEVEEETEAADDEISNAADVPLFTGSGYANFKAISKLRLVKLDNPGAGYKGEIPLESTLETIGQIFGDGVYNIEAINMRGFKLRTLENQRISLGMGPMDGSRPSPPVSSGPSTADVDRVERLARQAAVESVQQAAAHTRLVQETTQAAAAREREFMQNAASQTQQFFASILAAQLQGHQQQMAMQQAQHTHMMEMLIAMRGNGEDTSTDRMLALFGQGLSLGRNLDRDEQPFWQEILGGGVRLLGQARTAQLAAGNPQPANGQKSPKNLKKLARIMKAMRKRGIDADQLIGMLESGEPAQEPDEQDESEPDEPGQRPQGPIFSGGSDSESDTD